MPLWCGVSVCLCSQPASSNRQGQGGWCCLYFLSIHCAYAYLWPILVSISRFFLGTFQNFLALLKRTMNRYRRQWTRCPVEGELISPANFILVPIIQSVSLALFLTSPNHWWPLVFSLLLRVLRVSFDKLALSTPAPPTLQMTEFHLLCDSLMHTYHIFPASPLIINGLAHSVSWHAPCTYNNELGSATISLTYWSLFNAYQCRNSFNLITLIKCTTMSLALAQYRVSDADSVPWHLGHFWADLQLDSILGQVVVAV